MVKVGIDAFGQWVFGGAATEKRDLAKKSCTQNHSTVELCAHRDRANAYEVASPDPRIDDRIINVHGTEMAAYQPNCTFSRDHSQHTSAAPVPEKQRRPKPRIAKRKSNTVPTEYGGKYISSEDQSQQNRASLIPAKRNSPTSRVPAMLRALLPHNDGPPIGINPSIGMQVPPEDSAEEQRRKPVTRTLFKDHCLRMRNEPESPRKSLNVCYMMRTQLQGEAAVKGQKTSNCSPASSVVLSSPTRSRSQTLQPISISSGIAVSRQVEDFDVSSSWMCWEAMKEKLNKHFEPNYDLSEHGMRSMCLHDSDGGHNPGQVDYGFDEDGIYIFRPTAKQYSNNFTELLALMEKVAGQVQGVVKVMVPNKCISPYVEDESLPNVLVDFEIPIFSTTLSQCPSSKRANLYLVDTKAVGPGPANVAKILDRIQEEEAFFLAKFSGTKLKGGSVWRHRHEDRPFTEESMLICATNAEKSNPWCALDLPATPELREALECDNLHLGEDRSNGFHQSATVRAGEAGPGLDQSCFHLSTRSGTMFLMQLGDFAAYTVNYHHAGGPRSYTIVKPSSHQRLEEFICLAFQQSKNPKPPSCSQFVSHEEVYIPKETLIANGIEFTEVTQFERELLVIFPYAYYQGFNGAANVVEEVMYASKEWEVFHREGLYVKCSKDCADGHEDFDLSFAEKRGDSAEDSDDHDIRQPASKRPCLRK